MSLSDLSARMQASHVHQSFTKRTALDCKHKSIFSLSTHQQHCRAIPAASLSNVTDSAAASTSGRCDQTGDQIFNTQAGSSRLTQASRRQLLLGNAALIAYAAAAGLHPAHAAAQAAGGGCQLQDSKTGLQWCDLQLGEGQLPIKSAFTKLNYTAKLASTGAVFDSTYQRRQPLIIKVGECEMVQAFDVAVLGAEDIPPMREGGKRLVVAPPGPMQRQGVKSLQWVTGLLDALDEAAEGTLEGGFNSTLVFEVELMKKRRATG